MEKKESTGKSPADKKKTVACADADTAVAVTGDRRQYLIAPRRGVHARAAGIVPLSVNELHATVNQLPNVEVMHVMTGHKHSHLHSVRHDEATHTFVVKMESDHAHHLRNTLPPHLVVEEDHHLTYGRKPEVEGTGYLHPLDAVGGPITRQVMIRVVGPNDEAVAGASITLGGDGMPSSASTNEHGEASLALTQMQAGPARNLFVRPVNSYWNRYLLSPQLSSERVNVVRVTQLSEPNPDVPPQSDFGWGQRLMGLDDTTLNRGRGVRVAIVDSGADSTHPSLAHIQYGSDLTANGDSNSWRLDSIGHGSHCAGVIAAKPSPEAAAARQAMRGFAPEAEIHILKIFPGGQFSTLLQALDYCIDHDIDVVNLSLGAPQPSEVVEQRLIEAAHSGVACIVAAGNSGGPVQYPARSPNVLAVAALGLQTEMPGDTWEMETQVVSQTRTQGGLFAPAFSCFGPQIAVCAPGVGIVSTVPGAAFASDSGTSMAAPHITGLAALLLSDPQLAPYLGPRGLGRVAALFGLVRTMCLPIGPQDPDNRFGAGLPHLQTLRRLQQYL